jgi:L-ascorbate metabolism protein UlaG (beta-lactamase superfamily)
LEASVRLTKFGHSCVRLEEDGRVLVIDPGAMTEAAAVEGADCILITHEHFDHYSPKHIHSTAAQNPRLGVWTVSAVAELLTGLGDRVHVIGDGDKFTAAGFDVEAHGTWHAALHGDIPLINNTGFLINQRLFHPGDALTVLGKPVETLMLPVHAPWLRISDLIEWTRELSPRRAIAVHDGALNAVGIAMVNGLLGQHGPGIGSRYLRLEPQQYLDDL